MEILNPILQNTISELESEFNRIESNRKEEIQALADQLKSSNLHKLIFVCTHNSRRSQLAEVWVNQLSQMWELDLQAYSAGSEATAFNFRMVNALRKTGFDLQLKAEGENPVYKLNNWDHEYYSKSIGHEKLPISGFAAVMVCSDADKNCPVIIGANYRVAIKYNDPKSFDGSEMEEKAYEDKVREIGREIIYLIKMFTA